MKARALTPRGGNSRGMISWKIARKTNRLALRSSQLTSRTLESFKKKRKKKAWADVHSTQLGAQIHTFVDMDATVDAANVGVDAAASTLLEFAIEKERETNRRSQRLSSHFNLQNDASKKKTATSLEALDLADSRRKPRSRRRRPPPQLRKRAPRA